MNDIINKFLLVGDKFMPGMYLRQPGFTYSACWPFTKNKERIQKYKQTGDSRCIYRNELDKACFQHDMAYVDFKDLKRRTTADNLLRDKEFNIAKNLNMMDFKEAWPLWFIYIMVYIKRLKAVVSHLQINLYLKMSNWLKNFINLSLENLREGKYIQHSTTIFGLQIWQICN